MEEEKEGDREQETGGAADKETAENGEDVRGEAKRAGRYSYTHSELTPPSRLDAAESLALWRQRF